MPHLSKRKLDRKTEKLLLDAFDSLFANLNKKQAGEVLSSLLTSTERLMIAKRIGAALLIRDERPESEIAEALKLTRQTVDKYTLIIKAGKTEVWNFIFRKLKRWREFAALKEALKKAGLAALKTFSRGMAGRI